MEIPAAAYDASTWVIPVLLAVTLHEAAHGFAALLFGDDTARRAGRISLNPFRHVDRFGTVVLPALLLLARSPVLFGYAKPVPVNFKALQPPRVGAIAVAAAGPGMNVLLALASALLLEFPFLGAWGGLMLHHSILLNAALAVFNMLPILPLDGGRVLAALLPEFLARPFRRLESYGMLLIFALLMLPLIGVDLLGGYMVAATRTVVSAVMQVSQN